VTEVSVQCHGCPPGRNTCPWPAHLLCPRGDCTKKPTLAGLRVCPGRLWR
jgi:hypothetical protein